MAAAPAPLPLGLQPQETKHTIPVAPKIDERVLHLDKMDRFWVNCKQKSHGKQWIAACLEKAGLIEIDCHFLPNDKCVFYWCQREFAFFDHQLFTGNENKPLIAFTPSQGLICDKTRFAQNLYAYYGNDAWKVTPLTVDLEWDTESARWIITQQIAELMQSRAGNAVWITKSSLGSLGSGVFLFRGNDVASFEQFIASRYNPVNWGKRLQESGCVNLGIVEFKSIILQQYIDRPLLFNNHYKFDLRVYSLLASTNPCILFYHIGKMRICGVKYTDLAQFDDEMVNNDETLRYGHLSNCKVQRSHDKYDHSSASIEGQTMLNDWDSFIKFVYDVAVNQKRFQLHWFEKYQCKMNEFSMQDMRDLIDIKCCRLLAQCYSASKDAFDRESMELNRPCQFLFHGCDILIDEQGRFTLLECNRCPSISLIGYPSIKEMTKQMLKEAIDILLEIRQLKVKGNVVTQDTPLKSPRNWLKCKLDYNVPIIQRVNCMIDDLNKLLD